MTYVDDLKDSTHGDLQDLARKHGSWDSFWQDVQRLADRAWHNVRAQGHDLSKVSSGDDGAPVNEPAEGANITAGPTDPGQPVTEPAEPASPVSGGGFPTSNVGVVVSDNPDEGTAVPVSQPAS